MQIDIRVLELLSSKLCHDLVSPISAINNGVELIEDVGGSVVDEAMKLIGNSAAQASRRLKLFRMAYGRAGSEDSLSIRDVKQTAEEYLAGGRVTLNWPDDQPIAIIGGQRGFLKTLLNMVVLAEETLAYGGVASLRPWTDGADGTKGGCRFEIIGRNAQMTAPVIAALEGTSAIDDLTPRSIQAYITGRFAQYFHLGVAFDQSTNGRLDLTLVGAEVMSPA